MRWSHLVRTSLPLITVFGLVACAGSEDGEETGAAPAPVEATDLACWTRDGTPAPAERPSPLGETVLAFGDWEGKLCYGRPSARERQVAGGLIPFGEAWRLGANEATTVHLPFSARIGSIEVEAGSYTLYVTASETEWEVAVNRAIERWGIPISDEVRAEDVGSFTVPVQATAAPVETLTVTWSSRGENVGDLVVEWGDVRVEIPVERTG